MSKRDIADVVKSGGRLELVINAAQPMEGDQPDDDELGTLEHPNPDCSVRHRIREGMACTPKGEAKSTLANVLIMLAEDPAFERLRSSALGGRPFLGDDEGQLDDLIASVAVFAQRAYGIGVGAQVLATAIATTAAKRRFYPPREWLEGLEPWDGVARLHEVPWACMASPAQEGGVVGAFFRRFMIGAVARMMAPGCKMENVLVLQGPQGARKTTLVEVLFQRRWTVTNLPDGKDGEMQLATAWAVELGELVVFNRRQVNELKEFFSRAEDTFRAPYGADVRRTPRHCVFVGTTNATGILTDPTGSRRYWVVPVGAKMNLELLEAAKGQLWAEALALYRAGEQWWLTEEEELQRREDAEQWVPEHSWSAPVLAWLKAEARERELGPDDALHFRLVDVLHNALSIPLERCGDFKHMQAMESVLRGLKAESRAKTPAAQKLKYGLPDKTWRWTHVDVSN